MKELLKQIALTIYEALGGKCEVVPPEPTIQPCGTITLHKMSSILLDKLEEMGDNKAEIYLPDSNCKVYKKTDVLDFLGLDETDQIKYVKEEGTDCDDFAAILFGKFAGLVWTNVHALNFFISEDLKLYFIEPQTDKISQTLENWQGWDVRFFLGR